MYEPFQSKKAEKEVEEMNDEPECELESDSESQSEDEDDLDYLVENFIISPSDGNRVRLPEIIKIRDPLPGEVALWKKRNFPKAMRIHKKREDTDPHRFFLS